MRATITQHPPGSMPVAYRSGDIGLVRDWVESSIGELIQAGERVDYGHTPWANLTHTFGIVNEGGDIIEANEKGIERRNASRYHDADVYIISPAIASPSGRGYAVRFWEAQVGTKYDVFAFVGLALQAAFGIDISVHSGHRFICSGLVCRGTEQYTDHGYPKPTESMKPADIAAFYGLVMDEAPYPLDFFAKLLNAVATVGHVVGRWLPYKG